MSKKPQKAGLLGARCLSTLGSVPKLGTRISKPSKPLNFPIPHRRTSVWLFVLENPMIPIISDLHIPNLGTGPRPHRLYRFAEITIKTPCRRGTIDEIEFQFPNDELCRCRFDKDFFLRAIIRLKHSRYGPFRKLVFLKLIDQGFEPCFLSSMQKLIERSRKYCHFLFLQF